MREAKAQVNQLGACGSPLGDPQGLQADQIPEPYRGLRLGGATETSPPPPRRCLQQGAACPACQGLLGLGVHLEHT